MKKTLLFIFILILTGLSGFAFFNIIQIIGNTGSRPVYGGQQPPVIDTPRGIGADGEDNATAGTVDSGDYEIFVNGRLQGRFETYEEAVAFGENHERALLRQRGKSKLLWDNYPPYNVFTDSSAYTEFDTFAEAVAYAKRQPQAYIYYRKNNSLVWTNVEESKTSARITGVPWISQLPELPRGCEVTSLAMLLNYKGIPVDKTILADEIKKNPVTYRVEKGIIYGGSPYNGFVGDMSNTRKHGLGVYHGPIYELLSSYLPEDAIDLTGAEFEDLFYLINQNIPVWVIINTSYQKLPDSYFETWQTEDGELKITYKEHSVLITGYDELYIYFNDPLSQANNKVLRADFKNAWIQMGSQAVSITP